MGIFFFVIAIIIGGVLNLVIHINSKKSYYELREGREKLKAKVIEYKKYKSPMRNDFTQILYPHVILVNSDKQNSIRLKYTTYPKKPFEIGEEIDVFWNDKILCYWDSYDTGWQKKLPSNWDFLKRNKTI